MKNIKNKVHRGDILREVVENSGVTIDLLIKRMGYGSRNTYYNHIKQPELSLVILKKYSHALKYDFSSEIKEMTGFILSEEEESYISVPKTIEEAVRQRDFYVKLYMSQLELYRKLQEENLGLKEKK
ncbi:MAG: hypothetical protein ABIP30_16770 [Ferruginibacter sp.]